MASDSSTATATFGASSGEDGVITGAVAAPASSSYTAMATGSSGDDAVGGGSVFIHTRKARTPSPRMGAASRASSSLRAPTTPSTVTRGRSSSTPRLQVKDKYDKKLETAINIAKKIKFPMALAPAAASQPSSQQQRADPTAHMDPTTPVLHNISKMAMASEALGGSRQAASEGDTSQRERGSEGGGRQVASGSEPIPTEGKASGSLGGSRQAASEGEANLTSTPGKAGEGLQGLTTPTPGDVVPSTPEGGANRRSQVRQDMGLKGGTVGPGVAEQGHAGSTPHRPTDPGSSSSRRGHMDYALAPGEGMPAGVRNDDFVMARGVGNAKVNYEPMAPGVGNALTDIEPMAPGVGNVHANYGQNALLSQAGGPPGPPPPGSTTPRGDADMTKVGARVHESLGPQAQDLTPRKRQHMMQAFGVSTPGKAGGLNAGG